MTAHLYTVGLSHPGHAARLMLELKGIEHRITAFPPGMPPLLVRAVGFRGYTVPALKIDGRRIQHSLDISRELDRLRPDPPLFPADPEARAAVESAERWGEAELQPVSRRILRWALTEQHEARLWLARDAKLPLPALQAKITKPVARRFASASGASRERVAHDVAELPGKLDRVDALIGEGVLSADQPNAATFQVGTSVRALTSFPEIKPMIEGRPAGALAEALLPEWPEVPVRLP